VTAGRLPMAAAQSLYFYLSHAHDPLEFQDAAERRDTIDHWVDAFFRDLVKEVDRRRRGHHPGRTGAYRPCTADGGTLAERPPVGAAKAFVPLYSLAYLKDPRALAERSAARGRIVPVLWQPMLDGDVPPELAEAASVADLKVYESRGLLELSRLTEHQATYRRVLGILADRIVEVADGLNGRRGQPVHRPPPAAGTTVTRRTGFVLTLVADQESSEVIPLAGRVAAYLERHGYYDEVRIVRYAGEAGDPDPVPGLFLIDAAALVEVPDHLRGRILGLPADRLVVVVGAAAVNLRLDGPLRERVRVLAGRTSRPQVRANPDPAAMIAREILGLIRRQSAVERTGTGPHPSRTRLYD
jgi:hypothetical protein